ncbi:MAG: small ribosomal subunit Rsm22 family protein [Clostridia bacterium]|nr:small ribosomal subunit Rsm22 family protein [Clostridia bacterium]
MELPIELRSLVEKKLDGVNLKELQKNSESVSLKYRDDERAGKRLVTEDIEALAYAAVRMPATYGAIYTSLKNTLEIYNPKIDSVLDVGAGTGAGTWAVSDLIDFKDTTCLEREEVMINLGQAFMHESGIQQLENVSWQKFDLVNSELNQKADLVICSYVLNELSKSNRKQALEKLWKATNKILLIIEPGTPSGFAEIKELIKALKEFGGSIIAPCPNIDDCPIPENDWCHATCRVSRTKIHKLLKNGDVPYEDEKFSYIAVSKEQIEKVDFARVLRHPKIESGKIALQVCTKDGIGEKVITKKDKELFKMARKVGCGDKLVL